MNPPSTFSYSEYPYQNDIISFYILYDLEYFKDIKKREI
jgi:hypothetical protein